MSGMENISPRGVNLQQGEAITLFTAAVRTTAGVNTAGTAVYLAGERTRYIFILNVTAALAVAGDTLDVYIDWSLDNTTWFNGCHFTQATGAPALVVEYAVFDATTPGTATVTVATDAAAAAVRPAVFGPYVRGRYTLVDGGAHGQSFTFSLLGYAL